MKIVIQLIPCHQPSCNDHLEGIKDSILKELNTKLSYHAKDHIHEIEVLSD